MIATLGRSEKLLLMLRYVMLASAALFFTGCIHVKLDPIQVHATVDVNVKVEQAVSNLLADIYGNSATVNTDTLSKP